MLGGVTEAHLDMTLHVLVVVRICRVWLLIVVISSPESSICKSRGDVDLTCHSVAVSTACGWGLLVTGAIYD